MRGNKGSPYDGGHRVPCFLRWPAGGLSGGKDVGRLTAHIDLLPTLIELCRLPSPKGVKFDGASLVPLLRDASAEWPDRVLITDSQRIEQPEKWRQSAVMTDRWRLINGKELYEIHADPAQKNDLSATHPEVVGKLRQAYEDWWASVSQRFDEYSEIVVGSDQENPTRLTCHDWHGEEPLPWDQGHILQGQRANGVWALEVARAGEYEFSLRRWPKEIERSINAAIPGGQAIQASKARLAIGVVDLAGPVPVDAKDVVFRTSLPPGRAKLQTWLIADDGTSRGAYFVYVRRIATHAS
jgi:hypothetical protein